VHSLDGVVVARAHAADATKIDSVTPVIPLARSCSPRRTIVQKTVVCALLRSTLEVGGYHGTLGSSLFTLHFFNAHVGAAHTAWRRVFQVHDTALGSYSNARGLSSASDFLTFAILQDAPPLL